MKKYILTGIVLFSLCVYAMANGGITTHSTVRGTADPVMVDMPNVNLISEKLSVKLNYDYTDVYVKYILWNDSDNDYTNLDYGFPMDYSARGDQTESTDLDGRPYVKNIVFRSDGQSLDFVSSSAKIHEKEKQLYRQWHFTKVSIPKHSFMTLEVSYSVMNGYIEEGASPLMLYDFENKGAFLMYDFSPALHWGDGIIRDFYVEVDATAINLSGRNPYHPYYHLPSGDEQELRNEEIAEKGVTSKGLELKQEGNLYTYRTRNFELKNAKPLYISYSYSPPIDSLLKHRLSGDEYDIQVSNELHQYPAFHLSDMNLETAWVVPNNGIGEWMEFTLKKGKTPLSGITIVNGYTKNEKTYTENNRIKKILLEINDKRKESCSECNYSYEIELEDKPYEKVYFENLIDKLSWIDFFDYYDYNVYGNQQWSEATKENYLLSFRITILEIYPGTKYNDTCVSEILLFK